MNSFVLHLQDATRYERMEGVTSFVGEDRSGSFGIWAGHARLMTSLVFGLARFRIADQPWQFLAMPGALLYVTHNDLYLSTRRYVRDDSYERLSQVLAHELMIEDQQLRVMKDNLKRLEQAMLQRLWKTGVGEGSWM